MIRGVVSRVPVPRVPGNAARNGGWSGVGCTVFYNSRTTDPSACAREKLYTANYKPTAMGFAGIFIKNYDFSVYRITVESLQMPFPTHRPRRLRSTEAIRRVVRETRLEPANFILPLFICPGEGVRKPISSMPPHCQLSIDTALEECREIRDLGIGG